MLQVFQASQTTEQILCLLLEMRGQRGRGQDWPDTGTPVAQPRHRAPLAGTCAVRHMLEMADDVPEVRKLLFREIVAHDGFPVAGTGTGRVCRRYESTGANLIGQARKSRPPRVTLVS